jgi:hypothetical protein
MALYFRYFMSASELTTFVNDPANAISTVLSITYDTSSGRYVLFYQTT